jgi:uncharacterized protein (TIGR03435 family)
MIEDVFCRKQEHPMLPGFIRTAVLVIAFSSPAPAFSSVPQSNQLPSPLAFEVATIKPTPSDFQGRYMNMQSTHQFQAKGFTVRAMVSAAYNLPPRAVSGGPDWIDLTRYDILAATPGETRPTPEQQMTMLRGLLKERFSMAFHTEPKEFSVYVLTAAGTGIKLKESATPDAQPAIVSTVYPGDRILLPARNATMEQFAATLQRAILDRPVLDKTGLKGKYDFDLEWTYDDSQFGGNLPPLAAQTSGKPDLFAALQQLGLKLESSRAPIDTIVIDNVQPPTPN